MTSSLLDLAGRLERLTGPCRETDVAIWAAITPADTWRRVEPGKSYSTWQIKDAGTGKWHDYYPGLDAEHYTASLDAAMTLAEPGAEISISTLYGVAHVEYPLNFADHEPYQGEHVGGLIAPAICAAILRAIDGKVSARAASESSHAG